jgi:hypothetical protein
MSHVARETEIRDGLRHEPVIQLLRVVDLMPPRNAARGAKLTGIAACLSRPLRRTPLVV